MKPPIDYDELYDRENRATVRFLNETRSNKEGLAMAVRAGIGQASELMHIFGESTHAEDGTDDEPITYLHYRLGIIYASRQIFRALYEQLEDYGIVEKETD